MTSRVQRTNVAKAPKVSVRSNHGSELENTLPINLPQLITVSSSSNQFAVPHLNTTIRTHGEVNALQNMRVAVGPDLTPRSKAVIAPNVTKKMNFAPNVAVFKDLTPLNVNDSLYLPKAGSSKSKEYVVQDLPKEPQLSEFLEKIDPLHVIVPEPELDFDFPPEDFDFLKAYKEVYQYE